MASSDALFFSDGASLLNHKTEKDTKELICDIATHFEITKSVHWLKLHAKKTRIALQFPDELLSYSKRVVEHLQANAPESEFFVLADTSYGSCCVDFVAAQHYSADVLIHYGTSCLSPCAKLPVFWAFGRGALEITDCTEKVVALAHPDSSYLLMYDTQYAYTIDELYTRLSQYLPSLILSSLTLNNTPTSESQIDKGVKSDCEHNINGRQFTLPSTVPLDSLTIIYLGDPESRTLVNLMMTLNRCKFLSYNPATQEARVENANINKSLMKRYYMVEKAKDANIVGIVIGTLSVSDYKEMHQLLRHACTKAGKKVYTILVGKLNPAKLANFMEVDIFVLVACPENSLIDSSDFYKPIITPYELELACNTNREWKGDYTLDFHSILPGGPQFCELPDKLTEDMADVSLITGNMRYVSSSPSDDTSTELVVKDQSDLTIATNYRKAGEYLAQRSWRGLEKDLGNTSVEKAKEGREGIAIGYKSEPNS